MALSAPFLLFFFLAPRYYNMWCVTDSGHTSPYGFLAPFVSWWLVKCDINNDFFFISDEHLITLFVFVLCFVFWDNKTIWIWIWIWRENPDDIFSWIFLNENMKWYKYFWLKHVLNIVNYTNSTLVWKMTWRLVGAKSFFKPKLTQTTDAYLRHSASMG